MIKSENPCNHIHKANTFDCFDCGMDTNTKNEYYMVEDRVWRKAKAPKEGMLCIGCLEHRLGRLLKANDFADVLINWAPIIPRSRRLHARLKAV